MPATSACHVGPCTHHAAPVSLSLSPSAALLNLLSFNCFTCSCCFLDAAPITICDRVVFGPSVHLYTVQLSTNPQIRAGFQGPQSAKPITIGSDVWVGGGAIILPGERSCGDVTLRLPTDRSHDIHTAAPLLPCVPASLIP